MITEDNLTMFISIIVPTYNRAHLVHRAIESVIRQTSANWELIIVDDGSTDDTAGAVGKFTDHRIRYLRQENAGANKARNVGAKVAQYSYLAFLDSDDELFPQWIESFQEELKNSPAIVCCGTLRIEKNREREAIPKPLGIIFHNAIGKFTNGACYVIEKNLFFKIGGFDEDLRSGQHTELSFRLADLIVSNQIIIAIIYKPLVKIHVHDGPRIRSSSESKFRGAYHMMKKYSDLMRRYPKLKKNYAKIVAYHGFRQHYFLIALKYFFTYCKYSLITKFQR